MATLKKKLYGVGIQDANYHVYRNEAGKRVWECPYYRLWVSIIRRSYSGRYHNDNPTYIGCEVAEEWWKFSSFRGWVRGHPQLLSFLSKKVVMDKDILGNGKLYSPEVCVFVPPWVNNLFNDRQGDSFLPLGVHFNQDSQRYKAQISYRGKREHLGYHDDSLAAHRAWQKRKVHYLLLSVKELSLTGQGEDRVRYKLKEIARRILKDIEEGLITHNTLRGSHGSN